MTVTIVVARYNENIEWTKSFPNVIIYNKGNDIDDEYSVIKLNNVGREGHTYYKHIYDNYDNLDDYTIFLQGDPFDHSSNLIDTLWKYINNKELNIDFEYISNKLMISYNVAVGDWYHYPGLPLYHVYEYLFDEETYDKNVVFGGGAQFIVSKKQILARPREFYLKIVELLEYDINPIEGHIIERFHPIIFNQY